MFYLHRRAFTGFLGIILSKKILPRALTCSNNFTCYPSVDVLYLFATSSDCSMNNELIVFQVSCKFLNSACTKLNSSFFSSKPLSFSSILHVNFSYCHPTIIQAENMKVILTPSFSASSFPHSYAYGLHHPISPKVLFILPFQYFLCVHSPFHPRTIATVV